MHIEWPDDLLELEDFRELYVRSQDPAGRSWSGTTSRSAGGGGADESVSDDGGTPAASVNVKSFRESKLVLRGPRLRIGVYEGVPTDCSPHPHTGRATYAGQLVNRAARIASKCPPGHTLASRAAWRSAARMLADGERAEAAAAQRAMRTLTFESRMDLETALPAAAAGGGEAVSTVEVTATELGSFRFKGVSEPIGIVHVFDDVLFARPFPVFRS